MNAETIGVMFTASAFSVANIYYCQPLLSDIGRSLGVSDSAIGYLPMWTQAGTALGMFAFVPLGRHVPATAIDRHHERRDCSLTARR